ncbi:hypothetical protein D3C78_1369920 [compost metagenome]
MSAGISNGPWFQFSSLRARAISSLPSGAPWQSSLPCLFGEPKPMMVLQQIRVGRSLLRAVSMAILISSASWPSTLRITCQLYASKRAGVLSVNQPCTSPSMEMPLSS